MGGLPPQDEEALTGLWARLLADRPRRLSAHEGAEAFRQHGILASAVLRAALLDKSGDEGNRTSWIRYVETFFPVGRRGDAETIWRDWRCAIIKDNKPGARVVVAHGKPDHHWTRDVNGVLCIDLESMWGDFEASLEAFIEHLRRDDDRRSVVLGRHRGWAVRQFKPVANPAPAAAVSGSRA